MIRRRGGPCSGGGVEVSSWLDAPAALTSIQKQVSEDLTGQGQGGGGGVSLQCGAVGVRAVHPLFTPRWLTVCICCLCVCLFYKLLLIASLWGQLELRSRGTQPPPPFQFAPGQSPVGPEPNRARNQSCSPVAPLVKQPPAQRSQTQSDTLTATPHPTPTHTPPALSVSVCCLL